MEAMTEKVTSSDSVSKDYIVSEDLGTKLVELAEVVAKFAVPPVSGFHVGAVAVGESGKLYPGVNIELPEQPLQQAIHAEHCCIASAIGNGGETSLVAVGVTAAPCGHCRQMLVEVSSPRGLTVFLRNKETGVVEGFDLEKDLLKIPVKADLLDETTLPEMQQGALSLKAESAGAPEEELLAAFKRAKTPYSGSRSACAFALESGQVLTGSAVESVAFNPGVPPFQSCLIEFFVQRLGLRQGDFDADVLKTRLTAMDPLNLFDALPTEVKEVYLVQDGDSKKINHEHTVQGILAAICPGKQLRSTWATATL